MKLIEKLEHAINEDSPLDVTNAIIDKLDEIIDRVNDLLTVHPRLEESIKQRKEFNKEFNVEEPT
jgi:hypothetical protein